LDDDDNNNNNNNNDPTVISCELDGAAQHVSELVNMLMKLRERRSVQQVHYYSNALSKFNFVNKGYNCNGYMQVFSDVMAKYQIKLNTLIVMLVKQ